jgi:hypothetical protein
VSKERDDRAAAAAARAALGAKQHGEVGSTVFVERLDDPARSYFLVEWLSGGRVDALVQTGAGGAFQSIVRIPAGGAAPLLSTAAAEAAVGAAATARGLVWQPSRESTSPFRPFHRVQAKNRTYFVDMDGHVHSNLTPLGRG